METYQEMVQSSKVILDSGNYGFWKSRMKAVIKGIDVLAWKAVLVKWEEPKIQDEHGVETVRDEENWTEEEQKKSKFNSRALTAIHCSVSKQAFELIQGCETAKEAWDTLQTHFEGTKKVQSSRKDMLASRFENLKMEEHESIASFSAKLSSLAQEASTLGKKYKDKKLVKKFLRCLPARFMAYKSALSVSHNTDELSFGEVVGMLQAHEMELDGMKNSRSIALTVRDKVSENSEEEEDPVSLLVRKFDRALRKVEQGQGQNKFISTRKPFDGEKFSKKTEMQCHECKGYGHFKTECPNMRRRDMKCYECKGVGHTQQECVSILKRRKEKSLLAEEASEDDTEEEEHASNFTVFLGITEIEEEDAASESESEEELKKELTESYKAVRDTLINIGKENVTLIKENRRLEALVESLQKELLMEQRMSQESVSLIKDKLLLATKADNLERELHAERQVSAQLRAELEQQHRKIHMFAGTKQLDKILSYGRTEKTHRGLAYTGREGSGT